MRNILISIGLGILILAGAFGASRFISSQKEPASRLPTKANIRQVPFDTVHNQDLPAMLEVNGRLVAKDRVQIFSEVNGTYQASDKPFKEGTFFGDGEVLISMVDPEFQMTLRANKSAFMNQLTLMLPDLKSDYPESFPQWKAYVDSFEIGKPVPDLPEATDERTRYFISARNIYNQYYNIKSQEARLEKYEIRAPFDGKVSESQITEGTLVRTGQLLGEFFNPYSYELEASVSLRNLNNLAAGSRVELWSEDIGGTWKGRVIRISDVIDQNTQTVRVFISVSGKGLKEGMYLTGTVAGRTLSNVAAINRNLLDDSNQLYIAEHIPGTQKTDSTQLRGTLKKITVEPVQYAEQQVFVRGLPEGSLLVTQTVPNAYEGLEVILFPDR